MLQPIGHHLAELNVGRIRYDLDDPRVAEFTNNLELVNGLAERSPGFVWRYVDDNGSMPPTRRLSPTRASSSIFRSGKASPISSASSGRPCTSASTAAVPTGSSILRARPWRYGGCRPVIVAGIEEALARLEHLKQRGPDDHAFDWHRASAQLWKTARCPAGEVA